MSNAYKDWAREMEDDRSRCAEAVWCCAECGERWGECCGGVETWHNGTCNVCLMETGVCSVRYYGGLRRAVKEVSGVVSTLGTKR